MASGFESSKGLSNSKVNQKSSHVFFWCFYGVILYTGSWNWKLLLSFPQQQVQSWTQKAWGLGERGSCHGRCLSMRGSDFLQLFQKSQPGDFPLPLLGLSSGKCCPT